MASMLEQILIEAEERGWRSLPDASCHALEAADAAPRLVAHLVLVHDAAASIVEGLRSIWPQLDLDWEAVRIGASIHDIGKAIATAELVGPGKTHEPLGESFLVEHGFAPRFARHARTHGLPVDDETLVAEDLLVILADKLWKGARRPELEERIARLVSDATSADYWDVYPPLLDVCEAVAGGADERLAWHASHPAS